MPLVLKAVLQLPLLRAAKLLTDPEVAKYQQISSVSVIEVPVEGFVRPGDFVLSTGMDIGRNAKLLENFAREIAMAGASTLAIAIGPHTPRVPKQVIEAANRLKLSLIGLPWELRFSEISEAIIRQLVRETSEIRTRDAFVRSLATRHIDKDTAIAQGRQYRFDLSRQFVGVVAMMSSPSGKSTPAMQTEARFVEELCRRVAEQNQLEWIGTAVGATIFGYLQVYAGDQRIHSLLASIQAIASGRCAVSWGVGRVCREFADFAASYEDARIACELGMIHGRERSVIDFSDVLADRILLNLRRDALTPALLNRYIEPLGRFQRIPLLDTLQAYVDNNWNASKTAQKLSISRQSLLYRLGKIESILNVDLRDVNSSFSVLLALRLHKTSALMDTAEFKI